MARTIVPPQAVLVHAEADTFALVAAPLKAPAAPANVGGPAGAAAGVADDSDAVSPRSLQQVPHADVAALGCRRLGLEVRGMDGTVQETVTIIHQPKHVVLAAGRGATAQ